MTFGEREKRVEHQAMVEQMLLTLKLLTEAYSATDSGVFCQISASVQWSARRFAVQNREAMYSSRVLHIVTADQIVLVADTAGPLALRNQKQPSVLQATASQDEVLRGDAVGLPIVRRHVNVPDDR
jgi:hypothetical protein